jgi:hypothetical protein
MAASFDRTSWREIQVDHPADWEVAVASGPDDPGRLMLSDRRYYRLDVKWKPLRFVPNLDLMLTRYHKSDRKDHRQIAPLATAPPPWKGVVVKTDSGRVVHAMRYFSDPRMLIEASLIWPDRRDPAVESAVLASIEPASVRGDRRLWQAMGLSVTCPARYDLRKFDPKVGRVQWDFSAMRTQEKADRSAGVLRVERIAMPDRLLDGRSIRDWVADELPTGTRTLNQKRRADLPHAPEEIISVSPAPIGARLRGYQDVRFDLAWLCPVESRVYHVQLTQRRTDEQIELPQQFRVSCCRPVPGAAASRNVG